nr:unnamed protein product [Digitaria exilis]
MAPGSSEWLMNLARAAQQRLGPAKRAGLRGWLGSLVRLGSPQPGPGPPIRPSARAASPRVDLDRPFDPTAQRRFRGYKRCDDETLTLAHFVSFSSPPGGSRALCERRRLLCAGVPRPPRRRAMDLTMAGAFFLTSPPLFLLPPPTDTKSWRRRGTPRWRARSPKVNAPPSSGSLVLLCALAHQRPGGEAFLSARSETGVPA